MAQGSMTMEPSHGKVGGDEQRASRVAGWWKVSGVRVWENGTETKVWALGGGDFRGSSGLGGWPKAKPPAKKAAAAEKENEK